MFLLIGALAAAIGNWFFLRHAILMAPDSWRMWEGSLSLMDGQGYHSFTGDRSIREWPPLVSVYLAMWQKLLGVSGATLVYAQAVLAGLVTWSWARLAFAVSPLDLAGRSSQSWLDRYAYPTFVTFFIALYTATRFEAVRGNHLALVFVPLLMFRLEAAFAQKPAAARASSASAFWREPAFFVHAAWAGIWGAATLLSHNSSAAFITAGAGVLFLASGVSSGKRAAGAALFVGIALLPSVVLRVVLHQGGSHSFGLHAGLHSPWQYAVQALGGSATLLERGRPVAIALVLILAWSAWAAYDRRRFSPAMHSAIRARFIFVVGTLASLVIIFSLTRISDNLSGRFLFFVALTLVPLAIASAASHGRSLPSLAVGLVAAYAVISWTIARWDGVEATPDARRFRPDQLVWKNDCIRDPEGIVSDFCSDVSNVRIPPAPGLATNQ